MPSRNEFGRYVGLREVEIDTSTNRLEPKPTRTIKISEGLYRRLVAHSKRYYNVESYETILSNLLTDFDKHHNNESYYGITFTRN